MLFKEGNYIDRCNQMINIIFISQMNCIYTNILEILKKLKIMINKLLLPIVALCIVGITTNAQNLEKPKATFGFKAGVNFSKFRLKDPVGLESKSRKGVVGGLFIDIPFGRIISFQPEFLYSQMGSKLNGITNTSTEADQRLDYFSLPLLLKFNVSPHFSFLLGPQFNFLTSVKLTADNTTISNDGKFKKNDIAATAGIQFWIGRYFGIDARYIYGTKNIAYYNSSSTSNFGKTYNQAFQVTANFRFGKPAVETARVAPPVAPVVTPQVVDTDADGINDNDDKCPSVAGLAKYAGCPIPDTDGDGINDELDKCVTVAGLAKYGGCPIPDTDGDGINDEEDKCPNQAGLAKYAGCPIPDTDADGINDEEDRCPTVAGVADNKGCPKIENFQANEVTFGSGKAVLTASGKRELDLAVKYMAKYPEIKVRLDGHTDSSGTDKINQPLSVKRAEAAMRYMISKGVDAARISAEGHGSSMPIAENKKPVGRAQNRRVEITIL